MSKSKTDASAGKRAPGSFEVGRGKPPRHTQFKPGQSGNPGGRRKGSCNLKTVLEAVMSSTIEISENGRKRQVPIVEALIYRQVQEGLRGQLRAIENLLDRYARHVEDEGGSEDELDEEDRAILLRVLGDERGTAQTAEACSRNPDGRDAGDA